MEGSEQDTFSEDQIELEVLTRKPVCFLIIGKPGAGKTTLAKRLAAVWKCQLVDGTGTIEQAIRDETPLGVEAKQKLLNGEELDEDFVGRVIAEKLNSPEIKHYGYVLDCLPSPCEGWRNLEEQMEFVRELDLPPDVIINLKIPDQDLKKRRVGQKVDPFSNEVFVKALYDPETKPQGRGEGGGEEGEGEEGEEEEEEEEGGGEEGGDKESKDDEFEDDLGELESLNHLAVDIAGRLVRRPLDLPQPVEEQITHYKDTMLRTLEDYIIQHNQQCVIELDANLQPMELFKSLLVRLTVLGLPRAPAPRRLVTPEEEEEEPEGIDTEQFLQQLSEMGILVPRFRWRRSQWGRFCPVQLAQGNMVLGRMEFAVGFLDKMYSMSSAEALVQFTRNPRAFLLPPNPRIPCKVCLVGSPSSGKTTLARLIAEKYNANVLDMSELLQPVVERAQEAAVEEARQEAQNNAIASISSQLAAQQAHQEEGQSEELPEVTVDHPDVVRAVAAAVERAQGSTPELTLEMYMMALKSGVEQAQQRRRELEPEGPRFGGWVVDGFPLTREHWSAMIEQELLPDFVLSLEEGSSQSDLLLGRFCQLHGLPDPASLRATATPGQEEGREEPTRVVPPEVQQWQKRKAEFDRHWGPLSAAIKGSAIDPLPVDCSLSLQEMLQSASSQMEGVFDLKATEFSALEEDADGDDDPILDEGVEGEEEEEEESEERKLRRKPWGDSAQFCPVALREMAVLWPGNQDIAVKYRERLYCFSTEEAKAKFTANPGKYIAQDSPLQPPPLRVFLLGPRGSGKTTVGRMLVESLGVFHVAFRELLQEQVLPKMKRPPLVDEDEWEDPQEEERQEEEGKGEGGGEERDLDDDVREQLTEGEAELRAYLLHGDPLTEETTERHATQFWNSEPYKSTGFILEGFPSSGDELRLLASKGLFPDATVVMEVGEGSVVGRLLPRRVEVWRRKRDRRRERRARAREKKLKEWEEDKAHRLAELKAEHEEKMAAKRAEREAEGEEAEDEEEGEDEDMAAFHEQLTEIEEEQFPEEEGEEEGEEGEEEARERMRGALIEKFEEQNEAISALKDVLTELQIPHHTVDASRKVPVVQYSLGKALQRYSSNRQGLLAKTSAITGDMAKKLLDHGYKHLSQLKRWCPVKFLESPRAVLPPPQRAKSQQCPVVYRQRVFFPSSPQAREQFLANPERFLNQSIPGPTVPIRVAIVGPPKSGKSTVARRFASEYGCVRLSIGEAMRRVMVQFPHSELTRLMQSYLQAGQAVPDDLCVLALERALLDVQCCTRGYVLDGWPLTKAQVELLAKFHITPVCIVELEVSDQEVLRRGEGDRSAPDRTQPLHDSAAILLVRSSHYRKHVEAVRTWYSGEHSNWHRVDGERSQWWVWGQVHQRALHSAQQIQQYLARTTTGQAASVSGLCITPSEFKSRLGEFAQYCPVSLLVRGELVDCSNTLSLQFAAEYRGRYYKMESEAELEAFLATPDKFVSPETLRKLPPSELLPVRKCRADVKAMFPKQFEIQGFCPVSYVDGKKTYESLCPGDPELVAEYKGKLYCFASEDRLNKFMRRPDHYEVATLPSKLPPVRQPVPVTSLPMLGYLEQTVATAIINALSAVGALKPKYPFLDSTKSALLYVACHLKAYNPKSNEYIRNKYKRKLARFEEQCQLIGYLSSSMQQGYKEPQERPIDFHHKMVSFLKLKRAPPALTT